MDDVEKIQGDYKKALETENLEQFKSILEKSKILPNDEIGAMMYRLALSDFIIAVKVYMYLHPEEQNPYEIRFYSHPIRRIDIEHVKKENIYKLIRAMIIHEIPCNVMNSYMEDIFNILIIDNKNIDGNDVRNVKLLLYSIFLNPRSQRCNFFSVLANRELSPGVIQYIELLRETQNIRLEQLMIDNGKTYTPEVLDYIFKSATKKNFPEIDQKFLSCIDYLTSEIYFNRGETISSSRSEQFCQYLGKIFDEFSEYTDHLSFPLIHLLASKHTIFFPLLTKLIEKNIYKRDTWEMLVLVNNIIRFRNSLIVEIFLKKIEEIPEYQIILDCCIVGIMMVYHNKTKQPRIAVNPKIFDAYPKYVLLEGASKFLTLIFPPLTLIEFMKKLDLNEENKKGIFSNILFYGIKNYSRNYFDDLWIFMDDLKDYITPKVISTMIKCIANIPEQFIKQCEEYIYQNPKDWLNKIIKFYASVSDFKNTRRCSTIGVMDYSNIKTKYDDYIHFDDFLHLGDKKYRLEYSMVPPHPFNTFLKPKILIYEQVPPIEKKCHKCDKIFTTNLVFIDEDLKIFLCSDCKTEKSTPAKCPICREIIESSTTITLCNHVFCTSCLTSAIKYNPLCPLCGLSIKSERLVTEEEIIKTFLDTYNAKILASRHVHSEMILK